MDNNFLTSLRQNMLDRVASPIIISFAVSWCLWNYKFIVILFSDASVTQTFFLIDTISFHSGYKIFINGFLLPLISAAAYIFIYPYLDRFVHGFLKRQRHKTYLHTPLSEEDALKQHVFFKRRNDEYENNIKKLEQANSSLEKLNREQIAKISELKLDQKSLSSTIKIYLTEAQKTVIKHIKTGNNWEISETDLFGFPGMLPGHKDELEALIKAEIVVEYIGRPSFINYRLTKIGRLIAAS